MGSSSRTSAKPGARAGPLDPIVAAVFANATLWRQRGLGDRHLERVRHLRDLWFTHAEVALLASGLVILARSAAIEAEPIARLQSLSGPTN
jgi:hypothetical protein